MENVISNIKAFREARGISQRELARRIHMSGQMISKIENCEAVPSIKTIIAIYKALGIKLAFTYEALVEEDI